MDTRVASEAAASAGIAEAKADWACCTRCGAAGPSASPGFHCGVCRCGGEVALVTDLERGQEDICLVPKLACTILVLLGPLLVGGCLQQFQDLASSLVVGRTSTKLLVAVGLSNSWRRMTESFLMDGQGFLSALCGPAFRARKFALVATWLQIYLIYVTTAAIPMVGLRFLACPALMLFGISEEIAAMAGQYTVWTTPALFLDLWCGAAREYYMAQKIVRPGVFVDVVFTFLIVVTLWLFIVYLDWGLWGCAAATVVSRATRLVLYVGLNWCLGNHKQTWHAWSRVEIFRADRWKTLVSMTLPAGIAAVAENLQMTLCLGMATKLGAASAAAFSLVLSIVNLFIQFAFSSGEAIGIVMNEAAGANMPKRAKGIAWVGLAGSSICQGMLCVAVLIFGWPQFVNFATFDPEVQRLLNQQQWLVFFVISILGVAITLFRLMAKQGRVGQAASFMLVCCWCIGFPYSWLHRHVFDGIMCGITFGYGVGTVGLMVMFVWSDWPGIVRQALTKRAEAGPSVADHVEPAADTCCRSMCRVLQGDGPPLAEGGAVADVSASGERDQPTDTYRAMAP